MSLSLEDFRNQWLSDCDTIQAHTSGSTGAPKPILLSKCDMRKSARATNAFFGLTDKSRFVCPLSLDYIAGKMMAVRAWIAGTEPIMLPPSNNPELPDCQIDLLAIVPSQIESVLASPSLCAIRNLLVGGAHMSPMQKQLLAESGLSVYESYGMTETCSHVALRRLGESLFTCMPGVEIEQDTRGCLKLKLENFTVKELQTNDIVCIHDSNSFEWLGRIDNVINSGGLKIFPEKLEEEISNKIPDMPPFYITDVEDVKWGRAVVLVYEGDEALGTLIMEQLRECIDGKFRPKMYIPVAAIARTYNGKIIRQKPVQ